VTDEAEDGLVVIAGGGVDGLECKKKRENEEEALHGVREKEVKSRTKFQLRLLSALVEERWRSDRDRPKETELELHFTDRLPG
jgi:hypothetical protein